MDGGIADDAGARHRFASGFELRLDESDERSTGKSECEGGRKHQFQRYEADIADDKVRPFRQVGSTELTGVQSFQKKDSSIIAQRGRQLSMTDVEGDHPPCTTLQQHLGKAAGGGADVETDASANVDS